MKCPACGKENPEGQKYCGHCGAHLAVNEGAEEPYYSWTWLGATTTVTREYYWAYYGLLLVVSVIFAVMLFYLYFLTGFWFCLVMGVFFILLAPVAYLVAVKRIRDYQSGKRKWV